MVATVLDANRNILKIKTLLEKLDRFESSLTNYAFCELESNDAIALKRKFEDFKTNLTHKIFDEPIPYQDTPSQTNTKHTKLLPQKVFHNAKQTIELLKTLKKTEFSQNQESILQKMELNTLILLELSMSIVKNQKQ